MRGLVEVSGGEILGKDWNFGKIEKLVVVEEGRKLRKRKKERKL